MKRKPKSDPEAVSEASEASNMKRKPKSDPEVDHPRHYNMSGSGVEAIVVCEWLNFSLGNAVKYILRADHKGAKIQDLKKAAWYLQRELSRLEKMEKKTS